MCHHPSRIQSDVTLKSSCVAGRRQSLTVLILQGLHGRECDTLTRAGMEVVAMLASICNTRALSQKADVCDPAQAGGAQLWMEQVCHTPPVSAFYLKSVPPPSIVFSLFYNPPVYPFLPQVCAATFPLPQSILALTEIHSPPVSHFLPQVCAGTLLCFSVFCRTLPGTKPGRDQ